MMSQYFLGSSLGFSLSFRERPHIYTYTHIEFQKNTTDIAFLCFAVVNPFFCLFFFPPSVIFIVFFCSTCEMPT